MPSRRFAPSLVLALALAACIPVPVAMPGGPTPGGATPAASGAITELRFTGGVQTLGTSETRGLMPQIRDGQGRPLFGGLVWSSTAPQVATVDADGQVKAVALGSATIVAALASNPAVRAQIPVEVVTLRKSIDVKITPETAVIAVGERVTLRGAITLADGQIRGDVNWTSNDNTIAVVNGTTGEVNGLKPGRVTITGAYAGDPTYTGLAAITVVADAAAKPSAAPSTVVFKPGGEGAAEGFDGSDGWTRDTVSATRDHPTLAMADARTGYAAGPEGALLTTADGGVTWDPQPSATLVGMGLVDMDFVDRATGFGVARTNRVYATSDGGATWRALPPLNRADSTPARLTQVDFADAMVGYASSPGTVFKTTDGGKTWGMVNVPGDVVFDGMAIGGAKLWLFGGQDVYTYADGAWSSKLLLRSPFGGDPEVRGRAISFVSPTVGWVGGDTGGSPILSTTTDGGKSWREVPIKLAADVGAPTGPQGGNAATMVAFADAKTGILTQNGLAYATSDGGATWTRKGLGGYVASDVAAVDARNLYVLAFPGTGAPAGSPRCVLFRYDGR